MLRISTHVSIPDEELELSAIRARGAGGQNVNKVSSAIHLRFDIQASSLPDFYKHRRLKLKDRRISTEGVFVITAQPARSQEKTRAAALQRLQEFSRRVAVTHKKRRPTKPTKASKQKRLDQKIHRGKIKVTRGKVKIDNG